MSTSQPYDIVCVMNSPRPSPYFIIHQFRLCTVVNAHTNQIIKKWEKPKKEDMQANGFGQLGSKSFWLYAKQCIRSAYTSPVNVWFKQWRI